MAKKPKPESDPFAVLAREWQADRDKLRRVREWAERDHSERIDTDNVRLGFFAAVLVLRRILNGTERKGKP
jgi:hypothetical protein